MQWRRLYFILEWIIMYECMYVCISWLQSYRHRLILIWNKILKTQFSWTPFEWLNYTIMSCDQLIQFCIYSPSLLSVLETVCNTETTTAESWSKIYALWFIHLTKQTSNMCPVILHFHFLVFLRATKFFSLPLCCFSSYGRLSHGYFF